MWTSLVAIVLGLLAFLVFGIYLGVPVICKILDYRKFIKHLDGTDGVYLTFDDGPCPEGTPLVLDALNNHGVKATFFVLADKAREHPELIDEMVFTGHQVAFHGRGHFHPWKTSPFKLWSNTSPSDFKKGSYFRPVFGKYSIFSLYFVKTRGICPVFWNLDPRDYEKIATPEIVAEKMFEEVVAGTVVLLHDGRVKDGLSSPSVTAEALKIFLDKRDPSLKFRRIDKGF